MSVEPPSSGRPTGPPSGPLSGPSQPGASRPGPTQPTPRPPQGPAGGDSGAGGTGGPGGGGGPGGPSGPHRPGGASRGGGPDRPWWKSAPRMALIATAVVAAVILAVVLTRPDGTSGGSADGDGGEVFLQAAAKTGPDPFTESTAKDSSTTPETPAPPTGTPEPANVTRAVEGSAPGLYGGTRKVASCDVEKQISALRADPQKNRAFASVAGVQPSEVPARLRSLTPVQLRMDTRVTNHGYRDGAATSYQAVLQAGTAVLVDDRGVPQVRCACGNPLTPPVPQKTTPRTTGDSWPSYRPQNVVVVTPALTVVEVFVLYDPERDDWFRREKGDTGKKDKKTEPPAERPSASVSSPGSGSASPCVSPHGVPAPSGCETTSPGSSSSSPSTPSSPPNSPPPPPSPPSPPPSSAPEPPPDSSSVSGGTTTESGSTTGTPESASSLGAPRSGTGPRVL
ncbi:DUF6777 domain-containing protein [Streptomyces sp. NPDC005907]|uniref:DUF6777 domain-containing protein n=1 Tax=Streptomyces sp. NPDC005907 TaxID=3154571 RepID=UPI0033EA8584